MKKIFNMKKWSFLLIVISGLLLMSVYSCKKPKETKAIITVKYFSDTTQVVPYAFVRLTKYDVNVEGQCGSKGTFEHIFENEAILDVHAWTKDPQNDSILLYGKTSIQLKPEETVSKSVFIK